MIPNRLHRYSIAHLSGFVLAKFLKCAIFFSNLPYEIISQTLKTYEESKNIVDKFYNIKDDTNVVEPTFGGV